MIKHNVGRLDGWIRVIAGLVVITLGLVFESWWGALGLILIATALMGRCPIYSIARISTVRRAPPKAAQTS